MSSWQTACGNLSVPSQKLLKLIHLDSASPFPPSISEYIYFIVYIDDFTRMGWIYLFKSKSADNVGYGDIDHHVDIDQPHICFFCRSPLIVHRSL